MKILCSTGDYEIVPEIIAGFAAKYPGVNVEAEISKAYLWQAKNPKSGSGHPVRPLSFLDKWMKKAASNVTRFEVTMQRATVARRSETITDAIWGNEGRVIEHRNDQQLVQEAPRRLPASVDRLHRDRTH